MKSLYKAATDMGHGRRKGIFFALMGWLGVHAPPAISSAISTSVCVSVETKMCPGLGSGPRARWSHPLKAKTLKIFLCLKPPLSPPQSPFLQLQDAAMGKTASKGTGAYCMHLSPNNLVKCRCFPPSKSWPFQMIVQRNIFLEKRRAVCF